jgi:FAD synthetase
VKRVLAFGTFDEVHPGHLDFFRQAKQLGDYLIVVVSRDETVKQVKGHMTAHDEEWRLQSVQAVSEVDEAVLGNLDNKYRVILKHKPDIIVLGYDQQAFTEGLQAFLEEQKVDAKIVRLKPFYPEKFKSSLLR